MARDTKTHSISLKPFIGRLQSHLGLSRNPTEIKKGHFAILAMGEDGRSTRLVVELSALKHPAFMRLLEMAEEEYGFEPGRALAVPCGPDEVRRILEEK